MFNFEYSLSTDRSKATFSLPSSEVTMTAGELEEFMRALAVARANLLPAAPNEDPQPTTQISSVPCNRWWGDLDPDAPTQVRLYLQHLGFGWVWIPLTEAQVSQMTDALQNALQHRPQIS